MLQHTHVNNQQLQKKETIQNIAHKMLNFQSPEKVILIINKMLLINIVETA